jgi:hypothetical protein
MELKIDHLDPQKIIKEQEKRKGLQWVTLGMPLCISKLMNALFTLVPPIIYALVITYCAGHLIDRIGAAMVRHEKARTYFLQPHKPKVAEKGKTTPLVRRGLLALAKNQLGQ